jgi:hypothetical protein
MKRWLLIICLAMLGLASWAQETPLSASSTRQTFRISGTVVDALTSHPLARAVVAITPADKPGEPNEIITGDDGGFQFGGLARGKYALSASGHGFLRQNLDEHGGYSTAVAVGPGLQSEGIVFRLRPDATVMGTITDEHNEPVRNARVSLFRNGLEEGRRTTRMQRGSMTDDLGHYRFSHLRNGTYFVAVAAQPWYAEPPRAHMNFLNGAPVANANVDQNNAVQNEEKRSPLDVAYPVTFSGGTTDASQAAPITVEAGDRAVADVSLIAVPAIHLRLAGAHPGESQSYNATIMQQVFDGGMIQVNAPLIQYPDAVEIGGLPPGPMEVRIQSNGKSPATWSQSVNASRDAEISLSDSTPAATVSGVARMEGVPAPASTSIQLLNRFSGEVYDTRVGDNGEFQIQDDAVKPGNYSVTVGAANMVVSRVSATGAKVVGQQIEISGSGAVRLTVTISKHLGRVDGVALRDGKPMAGAMIVLAPKDVEKNAGLIRRDQSDSDGTFSLRGVVPGRYTVVALAKGWELEWLNPAVLKPFLKDAEAVEVAADGKYQVKVKVQ